MHTTFMGRTLEFVIDFGDNDFLNMFIPLAKTIAAAITYHAEPFTAEDVFTCARSLAPVMHAMYQKRRDDDFYFDEGTLRHLVDFNRIAVGDDAQRYVQEHMGQFDSSAVYFTNGEVFLM